MALVTVGFNQIGTHSTWYNPDSEEITQLYFDCVFPLKQYILTKDITGVCTVGYYKYFDNFGQEWGIPVLYSDNNKAHEKISKDETYMNLSCANAEQVGWVMGSFAVTRTISAGTKIWFGMYTDFLCPRFSYGGGLLYLADHIDETPPHYAGVAWDHEIGEIQISLYFSYDDEPPGVFYNRSISNDIGICENLRVRRMVRKMLFHMAYFADTVNRLLILLKYLYSTGGFSDSLLYGFLKVYRVITVARVRAVTSCSRLLMRFIGMLAGFFERFLYRKSLNRVTVVLYSPVTTEIVLSSKV